MNPTMKLILAAEIATADETQDIFDRAQRCDPAALDLLATWCRELESRAAARRHATWLKYDYDIFQRSIYLLVEDGQVAASALMRYGGRVEINPWGYDPRQIVRREIAECARVSEATAQILDAAMEVS